MFIERLRNAPVRNKTTLKKEKKLVQTAKQSFFLTKRGAPAWDCRALRTSLLFVLTTFRLTTRARFLDLTKIRAVLQSKINRMKREMFIDSQT